MTITSGNWRPVLNITTVDPGGGFPLYLGNNAYLDYNVSDDDRPPPQVPTQEVFAEAIRGTWSDNGPGGPTGQVILNSLELQLGVHTIMVYARDHANAVSYPRYFKVNVFDLQNFAPSLVASIADENTAPPLNNETSKPTFSGAKESSGIFASGLLSGLQMDGGVAMTTGWFSSWNANDVSNQTEYFWDTPGDQELEDRIIGNFTRDGAVLDFEVNCLYSQLQFDVQFGSEEYTEFVSEAIAGFCHNDAFMITVDGVVVSLAPDCADIIAVNSVHPFIEADESECGLPEDMEALRGHLYLDDDDIDQLVTGNQQVEYDGMTIRLRFHAFITPGVHRVRIVIADVDDTRYDAAVFIGENSVRTVIPTP